MSISKFLSLSLLSLFTLLVFQSCYQEANAVSAEKRIDHKIESGELFWHDIKQIENLQKTNPKPIIVDVYTDWCKWCKVMDQKTFSNPELIEYLNANYHMVKFNAETKSALNFKGESYNFVQNGRKGYNTLATKLCNGKLSYPSFVVLDTDLNTAQVINGFKDADAFKSLLEADKGTL